jgi:hypothetical protein
MRKKATVKAPRGRPRIHPIGTNRTVARRRRIVDDGGTVMEAFLEKPAAVALRALVAHWECSASEAIENALVQTAKRIIR